VVACGAGSSGVDRFRLEDHFELAVCCRWPRIGGRRREISMRPGARQGSRENKEIHRRRGARSTREK
jgi:hypothetical protein